ncbi:MAG: EscU/YscU/HrcU family type III secretion system export apparatus switch protein [Treponema sp.]|jgi:flagellar biosynthesis protein|nr:EscU/YscU/HrcU family type III secretion system export apparatus switch protein [Treponema sp.]
MRRCNIKNRKKAAALGYVPEEGVPRILASGRGREAERIIVLAETAGITIVEDGALAALLDAVKPGDFIPPWCWEAAAKILAFVISKEKR